MSEPPLARAASRSADRAPAERTPSVRPSLQPHRSLLDETARADLDAGGLLIDFGGAAQHKYTRGGWRSGWGAVRAGEAVGADPEAWAEVDGRRARLDLPSRARPPASIVMRARSRAADQTITFYAGDRALGSVKLGASWATVRVALRPGALPAGAVRLELRSSAKAGAGVPRAEVDWLWLADAVEPGAPPMGPRMMPMPVAGSARRSLIAPEPRTYSFYLVPPPDARLVVDLGAAERARFVVTATADGGEPVSLLDETVEAAWRERALPLARFAGGAVRLDLTTRDQAGAVGWGEPEIMVEPTPAAPAPAAPGAPPKNVIVIMMDTARADLFGPFGGPDRVVKTPTYDALAARSTVFTAAYDNENWTKPSVATILSGLYPSTHGAKSDASKLSDEVELLSEHLKKRGFATAGFVANGYVSEKFGFEQGWDVFVNYIRENRRSEAEHVYRDATAWLEKRASRSPDRPFFLYLQTIDPHVVYSVDEAYSSLYHPAPYRGPLGPAISADDQIKLTKKRIPQSRANLDWLRALYWGEVTYHDEHMGAFLADLERLGLTDQTLLVVTNDHGEELGERGRFGHGHQVYEELVRAPLLMSHAGSFRPGHTVDEVVEHVDLAPTILDVLGEKPLADADGLSFLPLARGLPSPRPGSAIIEFLDSLRVVRVGHLKLMLGGGDTRELYDLVADPGEKENVAATAAIARRVCEIHFGEGLASPDKAKRLRGVAGRRRFRAGTADIDPETRRQLEALGYFGSEKKPAAKP